ncbi:hypothetical protein Celaphus_00007602 [Cervus elaphus hippelaphus]|uniref:Uncharacterized protein n=1 Tax=Cervus elaphus hippelaphus TaxID=46360 RepID=A0A212CAR9_CEREH|nr:hypothetical protein Celaphus_00007602 [Cervus elaphus hippelaphus]
MPEMEKGPRLPGKTA